MKPLLKSLLILKSFHEITYILDTINDSYIPIITPKINLKSYYYSKDFHSTLIQRVVNANVVLGIMTMGGQAIFMVEFKIFQFFIKQLCDERHVFTL